MEITEAVRANIEAMGENYDALKKKKIDQLIRIEQAIQDRAARQNEAVEALRNIDYTVVSISKETDIARTVFYEHEALLKRYVEYSAGMAIKTSPIAELTRLNAEKSVMQDQIDKMMVRDLDAEIQRQEVRRLNGIIEDKNGEIQRLERRLAEVSEENKKLKSGAGNKSNIKVFRA